MAPEIHGQVEAASASLIVRHECGFLTWLVGSKGSSLQHDP
jgi:hypothetical protein